MPDTYVVRSTTTDMLGRVIDREVVYDNLLDQDYARKLVRRWYGVKRFKTAATTTDGDKLQYGSKITFYGGKLRKITFFISSKAVYDEHQSYTN